MPRTDDSTCAGVCPCWPDWGWPFGVGRRVCGGGPCLARARCRCDVALVRGRGPVPCGAQSTVSPPPRAFTCVSRVKRGDGLSLRGLGFAAGTLHASRRRLRQSTHTAPRYCGCAVARARVRDAGHRRLVTAQVRHSRTRVYGNPLYGAGGPRRIVYGSSAHPHARARPHNGVPKMPKSDRGLGRPGAHGRCHVRRPHPLASWPMRRHANDAHATVAPRSIKLGCAWSQHANNALVHIKLEYARRLRGGLVCPECGDHRAVEADGMARRAAAHVKREDVVALDGFLVPSVTAIAGAANRQARRARP